MIKIGYKASAEQFGAVELLRYAVIAEQLGFDSVFTSDHFQPWRHNGGHAPFAMSWLGTLGARTNRIVMGTSVLTPTFRYPPAIVAQAFATLGCLFPNRIVLGVGTGESMNEVPATGMVWPQQRERTLRLKEALTLIRKLWREERVSFDGKYYRTDKATIYDRPAEPVPIYVAGAGPLISEYAGATAEGFICTSGKSVELYRDTLIPAVTTGANASQRAHGSVDMMIEMKVSFDLDPTRAAEDTRFWAALALSPEEKLSVEDPMEMERLSEALPVERAASRWIVSSDPDEHVERIRPYIELGFRHLVFHAPGPDQERFLRLYAQHVLPRLRRVFG